MAETCTAKSTGTQAQVPLSENPLQEMMEVGVKVDKSLQLKARAQRPVTTVFVSSSLLCDPREIAYSWYPGPLLSVGVTSVQGAHGALYIKHSAACLSRWILVLLALPI